MPINEMSVQAYGNASTSPGVISSCLEWFGTAEPYFRADLSARRGVRTLLLIAFEVEFPACQFDERGTVSKLEVAPMLMSIEQSGHCCND
jgi:hypothetical protein